MSLLVVSGCGDGSETAAPTSSSAESTPTTAIPTTTTAIPAATTVAPPTNAVPDSGPPRVLYTPNPDLNETTAGMLNAVLTNRDPDCRAYAMDANGGNYSSVGANDRSNLATGAPFFPGTGVTGLVTIDLVVVAGDYIHDPSNPRIPGGWNYESVTETTDPDLATHCRMTHNMIPSHDFGWNVGRPSEPNVWVTWIDHDDLQITYLPVHPRLSDPLVADDTDRNLSLIHI